MSSRDVRPKREGAAGVPAEVSAGDLVRRDLRAHRRHCCCALRDPIESRSGSAIRALPRTAMRLAEGPSAPLAGRGRLVVGVGEVDDEPRGEAAARGPGPPGDRRSRHRHLDSLERTFVSTVEALATALEASDEYTSSHARWITDVALLVGNELELDREAMKRLELGALFHDIGKIGDPVRDPAQGRPAHRRGVPSGEGAPGSRRTDPRSDRPSRRRSPDRSRGARALGRHRLPGRRRR